MIQQDRIKQLNDYPEQKGRYVLYWMQQSQRERCNHALEHAIRIANRLNLPVVVYFGIADDYPGANLRHYTFMVQGLIETAKRLEKRNIRMFIQPISPEKGILEPAKDAAVVVVDCGYTRTQKRWREYVAQNLHCPFVQVETDVIVPVETVSPKEEYAARTIRPKIYRMLFAYFEPLEQSEPEKSSLKLKIEGKNLPLNGREILAAIKPDKSVMPVGDFPGGYSHGRKRLETFVEERLDSYDLHRNDPMKDVLSNMSPYLHFGQISPLEVALAVEKTKAGGTDAFLEELIVRRELAMNFVHYNPNYDSFNGLPDWAKKTLTDHELDPREYTYSLSQLERGQTHDPYWNAAQKEMVLTGKMHGYMRMYWGKKIIEWTPDPKRAFRIAAYLNDRYELDGRDPNGYTGVAWCFGKHDRPWAERAIFGKVRYMNDKGLSRKFDADGYVDKIIELERTFGRPFLT